MHLQLFAFHRLHLAAGSRGEGHRGEGSRGEPAPSSVRVPTQAKATFPEQLPLLKTSRKPSVHQKRNETFSLDSLLWAFTVCLAITSVGAHSHSRVQGHTHWSSAQGVTALNGQKTPMGGWFHCEQDFPAAARVNYQKKGKRGEWSIQNTPRS